MASKIRRNLITAVRSYDESLARLAERLKDLKPYDHTAGFTEDLEVHTRIRLEKLQSLFSQLEADHTTGRGEMVARKTDIESAKAKIAAISADTDELERLLLNYELPKRGSCELLEPYLMRLHDFMSVTWRAPAESKRQMGHKCLLEWVAELDRMPDPWGFQWKTTAHLKGTLISTGIKISRLLVRYLWMVTANEEAGEVVERLEEIRSVIGLLSITTCSVIIDCFLHVAGFFAGTLAISARERPSPTMTRAPWGDENEAEVFRMITVEILRLEVAFWSPDLPTRVKNSTYVCMAGHLSYAVFCDNLVTTRTKIDGFSSRQRLPELFDMLFDEMIVKVWLGLYDATYDRDEQGNFRIGFERKVRENT